MKNRELLLTANLLFSLGGIVGNSLWAASNDVYTLSSAYEFYWFVTVSSFLIGVGGVVYHSGQIKTLGNVKNNIFYTFIVISVLYPIFWLAASASVASHLRDCLYIKEKLEKYDDDFYFWGYGFNLKCDGEIVSTSFGFANFIVWVFVLIAFFPYIQRKFTVTQQTVDTVASDTTVSNLETADTSVQETALEMQETASAN